MPIYDFTCRTCKEEYLNQFVNSYKDTLPCDKCGASISHEFPDTFGTTGWPENGITMEHAGPEPVHFKSRSDAKRYAKENNVELGCL